VLEVDEGRGRQGEAELRLADRALRPLQEQLAAVLREPIDVQFAEAMRDELRLVAERVERRGQRQCVRHVPGAPVRVEGVPETFRVVTGSGRRYVARTPNRRTLHSIA